MEIVALDPHPSGRLQPACVGGDYVAQGRRNMMSGEKFDHAMAISVANGVRRIDDNRAGFLRRLEPIKDWAALAHREYAGVRGLERCVGGIGGDKLDAEAAFGQGLADALQDCSIVADTSWRVRYLAVDAPTAFGGIHALAFPRSRPSPANSAATMSLARSMSNTRGRTIP